MTKKSNKALREENRALQEKVLALSASKNSNNSVGSSSGDSQRSISTVDESVKSTKSHHAQPIVETSRLDRLEDLVGNFTSAIARLDKSINPKRSDRIASVVSGGAVAPKQETFTDAPPNAPTTSMTNQQYYTPYVPHPVNNAYERSHHERSPPSLLTESIAARTDITKDSVSQSWTSIAATANAVTKRFNEDTGLLIAPLDYKELCTFVINSFDIIAVARKLIHVKRYINNKPLKLLDIIAFIDEDYG